MPNPIEQIFTVFDRRSQVPEHSIGYKILARLGFDPLALAMFALFFLPMTAGLMGVVNAHSQRTFFTFVDQSGSEKIILRLKNGSVLSAKFAADQLRYEKIFAVHELVHIGPFRPINLPRTLTAASIKGTN